MESTVHLLQMIVLLTSLRWLWRDRKDFFAAGNLSVYFSAIQAKKKDFRGPDFFVVLDTHDAPRDSWVVWEEDGKYPDVIVEILSKSTAAEDRGHKKRVYEQIFRTPEYFLFDPESLAFEGYVLVAGRYTPIAPGPDGRLASGRLGLSLGVVDRQLRFFDAAGVMAPTPEEAASRESERAQAESERAQAESERAERLAAKLRSLGVDPDAA